MFPAHLHLTVDELSRVEQYLLTAGRFDFMLIHGYARCIRPVIEQSYNNTPAASIAVRCAGARTNEEMRPILSRPWRTRSDANECNDCPAHGVRGVFIFANR